MRRPRYVDISIFILKYIFNWRFWIAEITKKSESYKKIIDKMLFEDDEIVIIPNTINVNKKIESEGSEFLPTDIIKDVVKRCDDIVIMNSCLCRSSNDCKDYPHDIGCIFLGPTCPCCCLWKVYPNLDEDISNKVEKLDGITVKLHEDNCRLCKKCLNEVCMFQAIRLKDNKISIDYDTCKGCGLCTNACKFDAITIDYSDETIDNVINRMDNLYKKEL